MWKIIKSRIFNFFHNHPLNKVQKIVENCIKNENYLYSRVHMSVMKDDRKIWRLKQQEISVGWKSASLVWKQLIKVGSSMVLQCSLPGSFSSMFTLVLRTFFFGAVRDSRRDSIPIFCLSLVDKIFRIRLCQRDPLALQWVI